MKKLASVVLMLLMTGCGTLGGAVSGAGKDLSKVGEWISNK